MMADKDEILRRIKAHANKSGYEVFACDGNPREGEKILHLAVQSSKKDILHFTLAIRSSHLRIAYVNDKGKGDYKKFKDLDRMLDFIEDCLQPDKIA